MTHSKLVEKVARAILADEQKSSEASGCDILLLLHDGHRQSARTAIRVVVEECAKAGVAAVNECREFGFDDLRAVRSAVDDAIRKLAGDEDE